MEFTGGRGACCLDKSNRFPLTERLVLRQTRAFAIDSRQPRQSRPSLHKHPRCPAIEVAIA